MELARYTRPCIQDDPDKGVYRPTFMKTGKQRKLKRHEKKYGSFGLMRLMEGMCERGRSNTAILYRELFPSKHRRKRYLSAGQRGSIITVDRWKP